MVPPPNPYAGRARQLLRLRRAVAIALLAGAAALIAVYAVRQRRRPRAHAPQLGLRVQQSAAGVEISKTAGGKPVFRVFAAGADKLRPNGVDELRQVRILIYDQLGRHADEITGGQFRYDQQSGLLQAQSEVRIQLANQVQIEARGLSYNVKRGTGSVSQGVQFSLGAAHGSAATARLDSRTGTAVFSGGVQLSWPRGPGQLLSLASDQAQLTKLAASAGSAGEVRVRLLGHARLRQGTQSLAAERFTAFMRPDESLRHLDARGQVVAIDRSSAGDPISVRAAAAHADFSRAGQKLQQLQLNGDVVAEQTETLRGHPVERRLRAAVLDVAFSSAGEPVRLAARGGAVLTQSGAEAERLAAPELDVRFAAAPGRGLPALASITTQGRTQLRQAALQAEADHLYLAFGARQQPQRVQASGDVELQQQVDGAERTSFSQHLSVDFAAPAAGGAAQPRRVSESGRVRLLQGAQQLEAERVVYTPATGAVVLSGAVHGSSPQATFSAAAATWIRHGDGSATLNARALPGGTVAVSLTPRPDAPSGAALGPMLAPGLPVVVTAAQLQWQHPAGVASRAGFRGRAVFSGAVRLLQAPNLLRADTLTLTAANGQPAALQATGHVRTVFVSTPRAAAGPLLADSSAPLSAAPRAVTITASALSYSALQQQIRYRGGVRLQVSGATLTAPRLTVFLSGSEPHQLQRARATGGVMVQQANRSARSESLSFDFATNEIRLAGGPPSILDAEHGKITGDPLTFSLANDEIQVGGKHGSRVFGSSRIRN
ncbi:MAG: hypothetical protein ACRD04_13555 [Terriglobales bacterium]